MLFVLQICFCFVNRGSNMSAHVLLNLLNELGIRDNCDEFNKVNNTRARIVDYFEVRKTARPGNDTIKCHLAPDTTW